jgi:hypothetical protein
MIKFLFIAWASGFASGFLLEYFIERAWIERRFRAHQKADPFCTCNDCMDDFAKNLKGGIVDAELVEDQNQLSLFQ